MRRMSILIAAYILLFGLLLGSFAALATVRIPKGESVLAPRSHCVTCLRTLPWYENIPVISYVLLRGRCRGCGGKISARYVIIEILTAGLALLSFYNLQPWPRFLMYLLALIVPLIILMWIDAEHLLLPDVLTLPGIALGFVVHWADGRFFLPFAFGASHLNLLLDSAAGALAGGGTLFLVGEIYRRLRKKEGMGGGDVKLAAMLGAFFGWKAIFFIFFLASIVGIILGTAWILFRGRNKDEAVPFGTCLGAAALLQLFWGQWLLDRYLGAIRSLI